MIPAMSPLEAEPLRDSINLPFFGGLISINLFQPANDTISEEIDAKVNATKLRKSIQNWGTHPFSGKISEASPTGWTFIQGTTAHLASASNVGGPSGPQGVSLEPKNGKSVNNLYCMTNMESS